MARNGFDIFKNGANWRPTNTNIKLFKDDIINVKTTIIKRQTKKLQKYLSLNNDINENTFTINKFNVWKDVFINDINGYYNSIIYNKIRNNNHSFDKIDWQSISSKATHITKLLLERKASNRKAAKYILSQYYNIVNYI